MFVFVGHSRAETEDITSQIIFFIIIIINWNRTNIKTHRKPFIGLGLDSSVAEQANHREYKQVDNHFILIRVSPETLCRDIFFLRTLARRLGVFQTELAGAVVAGNVAFWV